MYSVRHKWWQEGSVWSIGQPVPHLHVLVQVQGPAEVRDFELRLERAKGVTGVFGGNAGRFMDEIVLVVEVHRVGHPADLVLEEVAMTCVNDVDHSSFILLGILIETAAAVLPTSALTTFSLLTFDILSLTNFWQISSSSTSMLTRSLNWLEWETLSLERACRKQATIC